VTTSHNGYAGHDDGRPAGTPTTLGGDVCPVCCGPAPARADLGDFTLFECRRCRSWSSDALVREAATTFEPDHYFGNAASDRDKWDDALRRVPAGPIGRILDVGCGNGAFLSFAAGRFPEATLEGIELDDDRAQEARRLLPTARVHVGDALEQLRHLSDRYDLITLWDVFEHVAEPSALLEQLAGRLSPTGAICIQTIHGRSLLPAIGRLVYRLSAGRVSYPARRTHEAHHLVFFSRDGLEISAGAAGLRIHDLWYDRLARQRMDGHPLVTAAAAGLLAAENSLGNGLFVSVVLTRADASVTGGER